MNKSRAGQTGFSLLEVLVAFVILATSLGIIMQIFTLSARTSRTAEQYQIAALVAESRIAELLALPVIEPGHDNGVVDRGTGSSLSTFEWESEVSTFFFPDDPVVTDPVYTPYLIKISVNWGTNRAQHFSLSTIRLERKE